MTRFYFFILFFSSFSLFAQDSLSLNVDSLAVFNRGDERYSGCWAYVDSLGKEYALVGAKSGTAVYAIDDVTMMEEVGFVEGPSSNWREITVLGHHAYVTTEGTGENDGLQVIDLSLLPDSIILDTAYTTTFTRGHILQRDIYSDSSYIYINGTDSTRGVHILDVSIPNAPVEVGLYEPGYYIHDCHVRGDRLYACAFSEAKIDILDISDKSNPTLITSIDDPGGNTHSAWTTEDGNYLYVADERDGLPARVWDISDEENITEVTTFTSNIESLVHNPYILGDYCFISHNTEGLRVYDITDPEVPVEVGFYDTYRDSSGGFAGLWSACPYFPSGKIIGGDRHKGLFVWVFNNTQAGRFYGIVQDSITASPIFNAQIVFQEIDTLTSTLEGIFKGGGLAGMYTLEISASGYVTKTINIQLEEGKSISPIIELSPLGVSTESPIASIPKITVAPNPFSAQTQILINNAAAAKKWQLVNTSGQICKEGSIHSINWVIDRTNLVKGVYFLQILNKDGTVLNQQKLILQ